MLLDALRHACHVAAAALAAERAGGRRARCHAEETAFLPAVLEITETPTSPVGRGLMWSIMALFTIALAWSAIGRLDIVAVAPGKLVPNGSTKLIQPLEAGVVTAIRVDNGQHVRQGQTLVELDATAVAAEAGKSRTARVDAMLAIGRAQALLAAQTSGAAPALARVADATPERQRDAQHMVDSALAEYHSRLSALQKGLQKRLQELQTTEHKIAGLTQTAGMARTVAEDYKVLLAQNYMARHLYLDKEQQRIQQEQELASQRSYAKEIEAEIAQQRQDIETEVAQFRREQLDTLNQAQQQLEQARGDEIKSDQRQRQTRLVAPVAGTVQQLAIHTVGGVVTPAQDLLVIVPDEVGLEVEAQVINQDIGFVRPGQAVEVKFEAFPYTHYGTLPGKLVSLSQDAVKDEHLGLVYLARIRLRQAHIAVDGKSVALAPGMVASVEIKTEQRRIIEYFLTPLKKLAGESLKER